MSTSTSVTATFTLNSVNGVCGSSNGGTTTAAPSTNLCNTGTASIVTGSGPWSWTCTGANGGNTANCSANIQTYVITFQSGGNGTLTGTTSQTINHNSGTTAVTANPDADYHFVNWTGNNGFVTTTSNPLTISNVTTSMTITANFAHDAVNGVCGNSNGASFTATPSTNLCNAGTASVVTGSGPWSWTCGGLYGGANANCSAALTSYAITASAGAGGSITSAGTTTVSYGASQSYTITPSTGYHIADVVVDSLSQGAITSHTFSNVSGSHSISATFAIDTFTVSGSVTGGNGTLACVSPVNYGSNSLCTITPNTGYHTASLTDNGTDKMSAIVGGGFTIANVTAGHAVLATFAIDTFTITPTAGANGTISPNTAQTVNYGATQAFTITPNNGYIITDVVVDGASVGAVAAYTFTNTSASHTISASFGLPPVNGVCGAASGQALLSAPASNLCDAGTASAVSGSGPWTWTCAGANGGTTANCAAQLNTNRTLVLSAPTTSSWTLQTNAASSIITISVVDDNGNPAPVSSITDIKIVSSSSTGQFSLTGIFNGVTSNTIYATLAPSSSQVDFWYKDSSSGTFTITASGKTGSASASWQSGSHAITVAQPASTLTAAATQNAIFGQGVAVTGMLKDASTSAALAYKNVYLVFTSPSSAASAEYATSTASDGSYSYSAASSIINQAGTWTVTATFKGDGAYGATSATAAFTVAKADTTVNLTLDAASVSTTGVVTASGQLQALTATAVGLSGLAVSVDFIDPAGTAHAAATTTYDSLGHYQAIYDQLGQSGIWSVKAKFEGSSNLNASESASKALTASAAAGYAILIEGESGATNRPIYTASLDDIRKRLLDRSFTDDDIYYISYETTAHAGVDVKTTKAQIQYAIETWAYQRINQMGKAPLYIIMIDHGSVGEFKISPEILTPAELNTWIAGLETKLGGGSNTVVVNGSCYSGSFVSTLSKQGRVIITSSGPEELSAQGPSVGAKVYGEYFIYYLFYHLSNGKTLEEAFMEAGKATQQYRQCPGGVCKVNGVNVKTDAKQHPLLDDNGDGKGSVFSGISGHGQGDDGSLASVIALGIGTNPVVLDWAGTAPAVTVMQNAPSATVHATTTDMASSSWVELMKPSYQMPDAGGETGQVALTLPRFTGTYNETLQRWEYVIQADPSKGFSGFDEAGTYTVYYYAVDADGNVIAPRTGVIYVNTAANQAPDAFELLSPVEGHEQTDNVLIFTWAGAADPDGDPVTYTVKIYEDNNGQKGTELKRYERIPQEAFFIEASTELREDGYPVFISGGNYRWDVEATDDKGAASVSVGSSGFSVVFTNALAAVVNGYVVDAVTGNGIAGASVDAGGVKVTSLSNGYYIAWTSSGNVGLSASATGYAASPVSYITAGSGSTLTRSISLSPLMFALTAGLSGSGGGAVTSSPAGIDCGGDCTESYAYDTDVTLTAAEAIGSTFTGWSGGGCTGTGTCLVSMDSAKFVTATFTALAAPAPDGDLDGAGVSISDALRALRIAAGLVTATSNDFAHGDVAPLVNNAPAPDGKIDIGDVIVILRRSVGLVSW